MGEKGNGKSEAESCGGRGCSFELKNRQTRPTYLRKVITPTENILSSIDFHIDTTAMSAPANSGPAAPTEEKKKGGFGKYLTRMKTVLKKSDGSKRLSLSGKSSGTAAPAIAGPSTTQKVVEEPTPAPAPAPAPAEVKEPTEGEPKRIMRSQIHADRARKLGERFAVTIEPFDIKDDKEALRVEKAIRMRIHRSCHKCNTTFGGNKVCPNCQHARCKASPRYPPKKTGPKEKGKEKEVVRPNDYIEPDDYWNLKDDFVLTMPSKKPGGQPLVRKKPTQRIRRNCHECQTLFKPNNKTCSNCNHIRCTECPRDPAKKKKYPDGYPGDAFSTNTSLPVKYSCSKCSKVFPAVPHPESQEGKDLVASNAEPQKCVRCGHDRCPDCPRAPPVRVEPAVDPEVLKSLEAKLAALSVAKSTTKTAT